MAAPSANCSQHALRDATGICVRCRAAMCSECITKIDGINHCRRCLDELVAERPASAGRDHGRGVTAPLALLFGGALLYTLAWLMLDVLMPGGVGRP